MLTNNKRKSANKIWCFTVETYQPKDDVDGNVGADEKQLGNATGRGTVTVPLYVLKACYFKKVGLVDLSPMAGKFNLNYYY